MAYGYIYKITSPTGKCYIGQKKSSVFVESYWSSSLNDEYWNDLEKYGKENFKREILCWCETQEELNEAEEKAIREHKGLASEGGYNLCASFPHFEYTDSVKQKISENIKSSPKHATQYEFTQTQEFKDKIKNIVTGKRWYNNGKVNVFVYEEDKPEGFVEGMLPTKARGRVFSEAHKEQLSLAKKGRSWWHKGKENIQSVECPGEGWERGRHVEVVEAKQWWNNGKEQTKAVNRPGEGWVEGKIGAFTINLPDAVIIKLLNEWTAYKIAKYYGATVSAVNSFIKRFKKSRGLL